MDTSDRTPATPPVPPAADHQRPKPKARVADGLLLGTAVLCLGLTTSLWLHVRRELADVKQTQRAIISQLASQGAATIDVSGSPALGRADAVVTLIEFSDYECPFCIRHFTQTMPQIRANYIETGKIRYVFRDLPIDELHPAAIRAHEAARCAAEQSRFWELHTRLFSAPGTHKDDSLLVRAEEAGLKMDTFKECLASGRTTAAIRQSVSAAASLGAHGTPSFFIGLRDTATDQVRIVQAVSGAQPFEAFEKAIAAVTAVSN
ncbi:MAG: DsbA family protein [Vicinamibacterales bacterium]